LLSDGLASRTQLSNTYSTLPTAGPDEAWYAVWTQSHCERLVAQQLAAKEFAAFFPEVNVWSKRAGVMRLIKAPMFPNYLFVRSPMDKTRYLEMLKVRGLVRVLERGWAKLTPVPDVEIDAVQRVAQSDVPVLPHPHIACGARVRICDGALSGLEGVFLHDRPNKGRLIVSVSLLGRSVAVDMDCTSVRLCPDSRSNPQ
jgi:transcription antitermination factor NusG